MPKAKSAAPIKGAVIKPVRQGALTVPTIITDVAKNLTAGQTIQFIPGNRVTYTGVVDTVVGNQVFFKDGVTPVKL